MLMDEGTPFASTVMRKLIFGQFAVDDEHTVEGVVGHSAVLPCSVTIPTNHKEDHLHILWFKNFTEKLWDCAVQNKRGPDCLPTPQSPRTHISWKFFGSADLEISALQESDSGQYQCWIILEDTYRRTDLVLRVHGLQSEGPRKDTSALRLGLWGDVVSTDRRPARWVATCHILGRTVPG
ncbi:unnamed protein product [Ranitomeya imitator]|uniref:Ig-like domain-containing protein n=1 Tax=Ranitomeya imitator TaxID=111125 RepID=A0ABN9M053_9NEOB|nr:unnamed protein product [Ranitomeya imitator]